MLGFTYHDARRWEPKGSRLRVFPVAGRIATHARRNHLRLSKNAPWSTLIVTALAGLAGLPRPPDRTSPDRTIRIEPPSRTVDPSVRSIDIGNSALPVYEIAVKPRSRAGSGRDVSRKNHRG